MTRAHLLLALALAAITLAATTRGTLFSHLPSRRAKWRIRARLKPAPGFASFGELAIRWSRAAAVIHGRRVRPDLGLLTRLWRPATWYAWRLGRAQYGKRVYVTQEHQTAIWAPPRQGKTGLLAEWMLAHQGACVSFTTRTDLYDLTAGTRAKLGPVHVFNPYNVGDIPSTFRPDITAGCTDPETAVRRAAALVGDTGHLGEMVFWSDKAAVALAGLMHAAALSGADMTAVYLWANHEGRPDLPALTRHSAASRPLLAGLAEIYADTKAANSIRMTLLRSLGWLAVPELAGMVCGPGTTPVNAAEFAASRATLYMILRDGSSSVAAPLFRLITDLMHHEGNLAATRTPYRKHVPGIFYAIDEVANIGLPELAQKLADSAGFGSFMAIVIHSAAQLRDAYGADAAAAILGCCGTKIIMPGLADAATLDDLSVLCGTTDGGRDRVVMPEVIARLPASRALILHANLNPVIVKFRVPWRRLSYRLGLIPAQPVLTPAPAAETIEAELATLLPPAASNGNGHRTLTAVPPYPWSGPDDNGRQ